MVGLSIKPMDLTRLIKKKTFTALLAPTIVVILVIGTYMVFQQQPQNSLPQSDVDWSPTFRQDFARTGYSTSIGPLTNQTLWIYLTKMTIEYPSPAVVDGVAYFGSNDGRLYAVDATKGNKIWSYQTDNRVESSCTVSNGVVYFGSSDYNVYALDAATGGKIWSFTTEGEVYSAPAVIDGVVYIGSNDDNLYALDAATGNKIWSFRTSNSVWSSPAVVDGVVYVNSHDTARTL
jgi:outer membrane protein assembly factor BamB